MQKRKQHFPMHAGNSQDSGNGVEAHKAEKVRGRIGGRRKIKIIGGTQRRQTLQRPRLQHGLQLLHPQLLAGQIENLVIQILGGRANLLQILRA